MANNDFESSYSDDSIEVYLNTKVTRDVKPDYDSKVDDDAVCLRREIYDEYPTLVYTSGLNSKDQEREKKARYKKRHNYLVNRKVLDQRKQKSYLEAFREKMGINTKSSPARVSDELLSVQGQYGDSVQGSVTDIPATGCHEMDFFDTECYNEIYYQQIMDERFIVDEVKVGDMELCEGVSETASNTKSRKPRSRSISKRTVTERVVIGSLGPDVETLRPKLERAKSLHRYSELIRQLNKTRLCSKKSSRNKTENEKKRPSEGTNIIMSNAKSDNLLGVAAHKMEKYRITRAKTQASTSQNSISLESSTKTPSKRSTSTRNKKKTKTNEKSTNPDLKSGGDAKKNEPKVNSTVSIGGKEANSIISDSMLIYKESDYGKLPDDVDFVKNGNPVARYVTDMDELIGNGGVCSGNVGRSETYVTNYLINAQKLASSDASQLKALEEKHALLKEAMKKMKL